MAETTRAKLVWEGGLRLRATNDSGREVVMDSPIQADRLGPSPVELLAMAIGGCTALDVVSILGKMREPLTGLEVDVTAERAPSHPRYFSAVSILFRLRGRGLSREKVDRAVELSHNTYCSVSASLRPDCPVKLEIEITDEG